jgi:hypothetical protein
VIGVCVLVAVLLIAYWGAWVFDRGAVASGHSAIYVSFEQSFPIADLWLLAGVVALAGLYLAGLDVLYNLQHDVYRKGGSAALAELGINLLTIGASVGILLFARRFQDEILFDGEASR